VGTVPPVREDADKSTPRYQRHQGHLACVFSVGQASADVQIERAEIESRVPPSGLVASNMRLPQSCRALA
jgi:hypothetical protein